jgi:hypothetical protein
MTKVTGEALSPQKRKSSTSKLEISSLFLFLWVIFALLDPDPDPARQGAQIRKEASQLRI